MKLSSSFISSSSILSDFFYLLSSIICCLLSIMTSRSSIMIDETSISRRLVASLKTSCCLRCTKRLWRESNLKCQRISSVFRCARCKRQNKICLSISLFISICTRRFSSLYLALKIFKSFVNSTMSLWKSKSKERSDVLSFARHSTRIKAWTRRVKNHIRLSRKETLEKQTLNVQRKTLKMLQEILNTMKRAIDFLVFDFSLMFFSTNLYVARNPDCEFLREREWRWWDEESRWVNHFSTCSSSISTVSNHLSSVSKASASRFHHHFVAFECRRLFVHFDLLLVSEKA